MATENLMADFLREIRDIANFARRREEKARINREIRSPEGKGAEDQLSDIAPERGAFITEHDAKSSTYDAESTRKSQSIHEDRDNGGMYTIIPLLLPILLCM